MPRMLHTGDLDTTPTLALQNLQRLASALLKIEAMPAGCAAGERYTGKGIRYW